MKNKEIIFFSYDFPPLEGGISRLCDEIVKQFINKGINVKVLSVRRKISKGYDVKYKVERVIFKRGLRELHSLFKLFKYPKNELIITGIWYPEGLLSILVGFKNVVILAHGNEIMLGKKNLKNSILYYLRKFVFNKAKLIICNSEYTKNIILEQFPNVNAVVCPLGVDINRFFPINENQKSIIRKKLNLPIDKKIILTISRINKYKAHDVILKAISELSESEKEKILYCIVGRGNYEQQLKQLVKELNLTKNVIFYGFINEEELPLIYQSSDIFVLCTREEKENKAVEGFGLVFLEAQASGIPVIGVRQGGIPTAVEENNGGWLIDKDDYKNLSKYFKELINNEKKFIEEGKKARKRVESKYKWEDYSNCIFSFVNKELL